MSVCQRLAASTAAGSTHIILYIYIILYNQRLAASPRRACHSPGQGRGARESGRRTGQARHSKSEGVHQRLAESGAPRGRRTADNKARALARAPPLVAMLARAPPHVAMLARAPPLAREGCAGWRDPRGAAPVSTRSDSERAGRSERAGVSDSE